MSKCENCGAELTAKRPNTLTCSDRCRQALSRRRRRLAGEFGSIRAILWGLRNDLKMSPSLRNFINSELAAIDRDVYDLRRLYPNDEMKALAGMLYDRSLRKP